MEDAAHRQGLSARQSGPLLKVGVGPLEYDSPFPKRGSLWESKGRRAQRACFQGRASACLDLPNRNHDVTARALLQSFGLRRNQVALAGLAVALLGAAVPTSSQAHHPPTGTVSDHVEEDSVVHSPAKERRLERRTARITAPDVAVAQRRAPDDPDQVGQWGPVVDWPVVGVHVALLTNGKVVAYDSVERSETDPTTSPGPPSGTRRPASRRRRP